MKPGRKAYWKFDIPCRVCGEPFKGKWNDKTCPHCLHEEKTKPHLSTGTAGAIGELRVSVDLMSRGFNVFRALSPNAPCDLLASKGSKQFDIEVRTADKNPRTKKVYADRKNVRARYLALVTEKEIIYEPDFF
jgi:hypothetical protein